VDNETRQLFEKLIIRLSGKIDNSLYQDRQLISEIEVKLAAPKPVEDRPVLWLNDGALGELVGAIKWSDYPDLAIQKKMRYLRSDLVKFGFRLAEKHHRIT